MRKNNTPPASVAPTSEAASLADEVTNPPAESRKHIPRLGWGLVKAMFREPTDAARRAAQVQRFKELSDRIDRNKFGLLDDSEEAEAPALHKGGIVNEIPIPTRNELQKMRSVTRQYAAGLLRCNMRTIDRYASKQSKRLNKSPKGRILCDDKLWIEIQKHHGSRAV